jgi:hypothetical protein
MPAVRPSPKTNPRTMQLRIPYGIHINLSTVP